jgi:cytochrome c
MKVATLSTLWDYINRAMPWNQPKSLTPDEVYAVTAYLLNLGNVVPDNFTLSDRNMAEAQARLPNRQGMSTAHALWPGRELGGLPKPDVTGSRCMRDCPGAITVTSTLPDFARNQHGNLAEQNRPFGPQRGADTSQPEPRTGVAPSAPPVSTAGATASPAPVAKAGGTEAKAALALATKNACTACHGLAQKIVGPSFADIAKKYPGQIDYLSAKIKSGGAGVWGPIPMPAQALNEADAKAIAAWLAAGAGR